MTTIAENPESLRIAALERRMDAHEEVSRQMVDLLQEAIGEIRRLSGGVDQLSSRVEQLIKEIQPANAWWINWPRLSACPMTGWMN